MILLVSKKNLLFLFLVFEPVAEQNFQFVFFYLRSLNVICKAEENFLFSTLIICAYKYQFCSVSFRLLSLNRSELDILSRRDILFIFC